MKEQKKKKYDAPSTKKTEVELEGSLCQASLVPDEPEEGDTPTISIQGQEIGVESNYFNNEDASKNAWDY